MSEPNAKCVSFCPQDQADRWARLSIAGGSDNGGGPIRFLKNQARITHLALERMLIHWRLPHSNYSQKDGTLAQTAQIIAALLRSGVTYCPDGQELVLNERGLLSSFDLRSDSEVVVGRWLGADSCWPGVTHLGLGAPVLRLHLGGASPIAGYRRWVPRYAGLSGLFTVGEIPQLIGYAAGNWVIALHNAMSRPTLEEISSLDHELLKFSQGIFEV
ncbi:unnamed protein product [Nezara viridula]|uniref:Uncharacterized protein n=1 Tax=Nezara viridula TaxID=85310 RepID=A0A9P0HAV4_NEZVI|nr:unnamed protein product [Nezara viridula]